MEMSEKAKSVLDKTLNRQKHERLNIRLRTSALYYDRFKVDEIITLNRQTEAENCKPQCPNRTH